MWRPRYIGPRYNGVAVYTQKLKGKYHGSNKK